MKKNFILLFSLMSFSVVLAQAPKDGGVSLMPNNSLDSVELDNIQLPPIAVFLDAAKSYADVKMLDERVREEQLLLKISKKDWLKYFRLQGNYQYGTNSSYMIQATGEVGPPIMGESSSRHTQSWYNLGVAITVPLDDIFARRNKNDVVRSRIRQVEYESVKTLEDRQLMILEAYNEVNKNLSLLKVRAEAVALYNAQMRISERDFANGRIDIITLSLERSRRATATVQYQETRAALYNAVTVLEMLTKVQIIKH
ncbi:MAG: TolC family protein [Mucinivorans sp.]